jgi:hypothetical protein
MKEKGSFIGHSLSLFLILQGNYSFKKEAHIKNYGTCIGPIVVAVILEKMRGQKQLR